MQLTQSFVLLESVWGELAALPRNTGEATRTISALLLVKMLVHYLVKMCCATQNNVKCGHVITVKIDLLSPYGFLCYIMVSNVTCPLRLKCRLHQSQILVLLNKIIEQPMMTAEL